MLFAGEEMRVIKRDDNPGSHHSESLLPTDSNVHVPKTGGKIMLFIALAKFKKPLDREVVSQNLKDIEEDTNKGVRYLGIYWTLGRYDTVVLFEAPDEKTAMDMALKRLDRMEIETLVAVPADEASPKGPV